MNAENENQMHRDEAGIERAAEPSPDSSALFVDRQETNPLRTIFLGPQGLRAGWSVSLFILLTVLFISLLSTGTHYVLATRMHVKVGMGTAWQNLITESLMVLGLLGAGSIMARIEHRRLMDYNLTGPHRLRNFVVGLVYGFAALSSLVGSMTLGGWMHFGQPELGGAQLLKFGLLWGVGFLLVGFSEEGSVRCYLQFTLTRGINFYWALALVALICASLMVFQKGEGLWGVYAMALLGLGPCLWLHLTRRPGASFWHAAWLTSTFFGFMHTGNNGENWIGIFAAAGIGLIFCVSIYVTGSAWWAIGCHAAWDWAETFFYGTADSGFAAKGHFLTTVPTGSAFWSGGTDGPEGSILVLVVMALLLVALLLVYGRRQPGALRARLAQPAGSASAMPEQA